MTSRRRCARHSERAASSARERGVSGEHLTRLYGIHLMRICSSATYHREERIAESPPPLPNDGRVSREARPSSCYLSCVRRGGLMKHQSETSRGGRRGRKKRRWPDVSARR